jgi:hypothetical protein
MIFLGPFRIKERLTGAFYISCKMSYPCYFGNIDLHSGTLLQFPADVWVFLNMFS